MKNSRDCPLTSFCRSMSDLRMHLSSHAHLYIYKEILKTHDHKKMDSTSLLRPKLGNVHPPPPTTPGTLMMHDIHVDKASATEKSLLQHPMVFFIKSVLNTLWAVPFS